MRMTALCSNSPPLLPAAVLFVPPYTRALSPANLTPWLALFYDFNLSLFGLDPGAFSLPRMDRSGRLCVFRHALWLAPLVRRRQLLFVLGATTDFAARHRWSRHVAGMAFALLALLTYVHALVCDPVPRSLQVPSRMRSLRARNSTCRCHSSCCSCRSVIGERGSVTVQRIWCCSRSALWRRRAWPFHRWLPGRGTLVPGSHDSATARCNLPAALLGHGTAVHCFNNRPLHCHALAQAVNIAFARRVGGDAVPAHPLSVFSTDRYAGSFLLCVVAGVATAIAWGVSAVVASAPLVSFMWRSALLPFRTSRNFARPRAPRRI